MSTLQHTPRLKPTLRQVLSQIDEISTLPHIAVRVMEVAGDPDSGAADVKEVLEGDPALTARLLRCVNSSAYPVREKITNLQQAVAYLGIKQLRNLALTASVSELFRVEGGIGPYRRSALWRHMVSVAICARMIARRLKFANAEDVFLAGLMHDVGIILEDQFAHQHFCRMIAQSLAREKLLVQSEREWFEFDHTTLGEQVAKRWRFPELVGSAIRHHHGSIVYEKADKLPVRCVELANMICSVKGITSVGVNLVRYLDPERAALGLGKDDLAVLARDLDLEISRNESLFHV